MNQFEIIYRYDPDNRVPYVPPATADIARKLLEKGNRDFAETFNPYAPAGTPHSRVLPFDLRDMGIDEQGGSAPKQQPFAVVLACSDARVPTELIFNQACNALFVVRVAGGVLGSECLGSIDYALEHLRASVRVVVVLGHSGCGAVTAAVEAFLQPGRYLEIVSSHPVRAVVDGLLLPVRGAAQALELAWGTEVRAKAGYWRALIETAVTLNSAITAAVLRQEFEDKAHPDLEVFYGVYNLATRLVQLPTTRPEEVALTRSSAEPGHLFRLARELAISPPIRELLEVHGEPAGDGSC